MISCCPRFFTILPRIPPIHPQEMQPCGREEPPTPRSLMIRRPPLRPSGRGAPPQEPVPIPPAMLTAERLILQVRRATDNFSRLSCVCRDPFGEILIGAGFRRSGTFFSRAVNHSLSLACHFRRHISAIGGTSLISHRNDAGFTLWVHTKETGTSNPCVCFGEPL